MEVGSEATVDVVGQHLLVAGGSAQQHEVRVHRLSESDRVELVEVVARQRVARELGDGGAFTASAVVRVGCSASLSPDRLHVDALVFEQVLHDASGFSGECRAQRDRAVERAQHPCLPNALATGMEVPVGAARVAFERDGQER